MRESFFIKTFMDTAGIACESPGECDEEREIAWPDTWACVVTFCAVCLFARWPLLMQGV